MPKEIKYIISLDVHINQCDDVIEKIQEVGRIISPNIPRMIPLQAEVIVDINDIDIMHDLFEELEADFNLQNLKVDDAILIIKDKKVE